MVDIFELIDDNRDELEGEWNKLIELERQAHLRKAADEFDAMTAPKKTAWMKNRLKRLIDEASIVPAFNVAPRERHLPIGTRQRLKALTIGGSDMFEDADPDVIQAIRSCAYSLNKDENMNLVSTTEPSGHGTILLSVIRQQLEPGVSNVAG